MCSAPIPGRSVSSGVPAQRTFPPERAGAVTLERGAGSVRVVLVGAIDAMLVGELDDAVDRVTAVQPADVRLDLAEVDFLGSHGMAFVVRLHHAAVAAGCDATIEAVSRPARIALHIAGLEHIVGVGALDRPTP